MHRRLIASPRRATTALVALAMLAAAACTSTEEPALEVDPTSTTRGDTTAPLAQARPRGEGLAALSVEPPVAAPGAETVVSVPFAGTLEMIGPDGSVATVVAGVGETALTIPPDTAEGEYLIVLHADGPGIGLGAVRVAAGPGLWLDSDRLIVADDAVVRLRVTSSGIDPATPILIGLGTGWEAELGDEIGSDDGDAADSGPAGVLTVTESGLLVSGGLEPVALSELTGRDLFISGAEADAVQLISLGDDVLFSNLVPMTRCDEPALVSGSIGGPGGVRLVSVSGRHRSIAVITGTGEFSLFIPPGSHMLFGWLDGEPPAPLSPIPIDAPCGASVEVGAAPASLPPVAFEAPVLDDTFAVEQPACRTLLLNRIVDENGADSSGLTELVAGTLTSRLPMADVITLADVDAIVEHAFDPLWPLRPGSLVSLWGVGDRFAGDVYIAGVRHQTGSTLTAYPNTDRDAGALLESQGSATDWAESFATEVARSALCIQAPPIHAEAGIATEWLVAVTDLAGEPYRGATVEITGSADSVTPTLQTIDDGSVSFTFTPGDDVSLEELTFEAHADADGQPLAAFGTASVGTGLTYVLFGAYQFQVDSDDVPIAGDIGAAVTACASRPGGPYRGIALFQLADYFQLAALGGAILAAVGGNPAGAATPPLTSYDEEFGLFGMSGVVGLLFGYQHTELAIGGFALMTEALEFLPAMLADSGAITATIDGAVFRRGRITLLENDGSRLVGTLNASTGTVTIAADGLRLMTATLTAGDGCPIALGD